MDFGTTIVGALTMIGLFGTIIYAFYIKYSERRYMLENNINKDYFEGKFKTTYNFWPLRIGIVTLALMIGALTNALFPDVSPHVFPLLYGGVSLIILFLIEKKFTDKERERMHIANQEPKN